MKKLCILAFMLTVLPGVLLAQNKKLMGGTYEVDGVNPNAESYEGTVNIVPKSGNMYSLLWDVQYEGQEEGLIFSGLGIFDPATKKLFAAYGIGNQRFGLFTYPLNEKGGLDGSCSWTSLNGVGSELIGGKLNRKEIAGLYEVVGRRSLGDAEAGNSLTYKGTLKVRKREQVYILEWYLGDGTPYNGLGYISGNQLIGVWGIGELYGLETYHFNDELSKAEADWISPIHDYKTGKESIKLKSK